VTHDTAEATVEQKTASPFWFGPADRPLFGWLHRPASGEARGGVVLCPPLGIEAICVYFTYRTLAVRLAEAGLAVLRFDYDGTGDSFGDQEEPGRTEAWEASVDAALRALELTGVGSVGLVGMRIGALLAASAAARRFGALDALVLWDPCVSGRSFLREQRAFRMLSIGGDDAGEAVDAPGMRFSPETVETLGRLNLPGVEGPLARRVLVLEDPDRPRSKRLATRLGRTAVEWVEATGQEALLDPPRQVPPDATIDLVGEWIAKAVDGPPATLRVPLSGPAIVGRSASGGQVVERPVTLGPHELFGIVSEPTTPVTGPTIVFIAEGNTPHIGQSRLWVELGREWAASGRRVLRFDLSGNGDTSPRPGQESHVARAAASFDDVADACRAISPHDPSDVVLVGLCIPPEACV
jgi:alpha-beta hydrolase superfamily lysophospholipase